MSLWSYKSVDGPVYLDPYTINQNVMNDYFDIMYRGISLSKILSENQFDEYTQDIFTHRQWNNKILRHICYNIATDSFYIVYDFLREILAPMAIKVNYKDDDDADLGISIESMVIVPIDFVYTTTNFFLNFDEAEEEGDEAEEEGEEADDEGEEYREETSSEN